MTLASNNDFSFHKCCSSRLSSQHVVRVVQGLLHSPLAGENSALLIFVQKLSRSFQSCVEVSNMNMLSLMGNGAIDTKLLLARSCFWSFNPILSARAWHKFGFKCLLRVSLGEAGNSRTIAILKIFHHLS